MVREEMYIVFYYILLKCCANISILLLYTVGMVCEHKHIIYYNILSIWQANLSISYAIKFC